MLTETRREGIAATSEAFRDDVLQSGIVIYERLKASLEASSPNQYVAIHVDSGDFEVARSSSLATRGLLQRHPRDGRLFGRRIGDEPEYGLAARLFGSTSGVAK